jgi:hypothetical protein
MKILTFILLLKKNTNVFSQLETNSLKLIHYSIENLSISFLVYIFTKKFYEEVQKLARKIWTGFTLRKKLR